MAKSIFDKKNASYEEIILDDKPEERNRLVERTGVQTVPQIFINGEFIGGCSDLIDMDKQHKLDTLLQI